MVLDASGFVAGDSVQHLDDWTDFDVDARFLAHFAHEGHVELFAGFDHPARKTPLSFERLMTPFDEQHAIAVEDDRSNAHHRPFGKNPVISHQPSPIDAHDLDDHALLSLPIEFRVEDPLPGAEIELPVGDWDDNFVVDQQCL